jgi:exonuclease SbcC
MIQSIQLTNFKSYVEQLFTFHPGINLFIGSSNNGKTTIFRAFYWILNNRPLGKSVVSYWNRDKKGDPVEPTKTKLQIDDKTIIRGREPGKNYYSFASNNYEALKGNIPDEIISFLNMTDVNVQKQKEQPFLISFTSGEAAKYLNSIIKLDVIDDCLAYVRDKKKKCNDSLKAEIRELETLEKELNQLVWIDDADCLLKKVEGIVGKKEEKQQVFNVLSRLIVEYIRLIGDLIRFEVISKIEELFVEINLVESELKEKQKQQQILYSSIERYLQTQKIIQKSVTISEMESIICDVRKIEEEKREKQWVLNKLKVIINDYEGKQEQLKAIEKRLVEFGDQLPDMCPVCGGEFKKD